MSLPRPTPLLAATLLLIPALVGGTGRAAAATAAPVTDASQLLTGGWADGQIGDFLLENDRIAVVISAIGHTEYQGASGGNILDIGRSATRVDALGELYTYFDDDWPRQAIYASVQVLDDGSGGGAALIRAAGHDAQNAQLAVITDYSLADGDDSVTLTTTLSNTSQSALANFELGDAFHWGGCLKWAPGYGTAVGGSTAQPWMAGLADGVSLAYFAVEGESWGSHGSYWSDLNLTTAQLPAEAEAVYSRQLAVGTGDAASAADVAHRLRGTPVGILACGISAAAGGVPLAEAEIDVYDAGDAIYSRMDADAAGQALASAPAGALRLVATAEGYLAEERLLTLDEDATESLLFELEADGDLPAVGDTLTTIMRPLLNIPAIVTPGDTLRVDCAAEPDASGWSAALLRGGQELGLTLLGASYDPSKLQWRLEALVPTPALYELYDLRVRAEGGIEDVSAHAVSLIPAEKDEFYFVHVTDTHLPTPLYWDEIGAETDSSSVLDLRAIWDDLALINPEFVLLTGDYLNEGELEDFLARRYYTRGQRVLGESPVPVYLVAGNHDIGGWSATPPADGTARRDWWRFFGWPHLDDPPPGLPNYTQNYSFDYGQVHFVGLEAYDNYDLWRSGIYTATSFISPQLLWLGSDLAAAAATSASQVLFYHYDFKHELDLAGLGVEMALWGHIHSDAGDLNTQPYDLATNNASRGERSFRLVRVANGVLTPEATLSAGSGGSNLQVFYSPANDGTATSVTATVLNANPQPFEHGRLRVLMPSEPGTITVAGGALAQIDDSVSPRICYIDVVIPAAGSQAVTVTLDATAAADAAPVALALEGNFPNPFNPHTTLSYALPCAGPARIAVFDVAGREIARLLGGGQPAGRGVVHWDGRDSSGRPAASGVYLARLDACGEVRMRKLTLAR